VTAPDTQSRRLWLNKVATAAEMPPSGHSARGAVPAEKEWLGPQTSNLK